MHGAPPGSRMTGPASVADRLVRAHLRPHRGERGVQAPRADRVGATSATVRERVCTVKSTASAPGSARQRLALHAHPDPAGVRGWRRQRGAGRQVEAIGGAQRPVGPPHGPRRAAAGASARASGPRSSPRTRAPARGSRRSSARARSGSPSRSGSTASRPPAGRSGSAASSSSRSSATWRPAQSSGSARSGRRVEHVALAADVGGDAARSAAACASRVPGRAAKRASWSSSSRRRRRASSRGQALRVADGEGRVAEGADARAIGAPARSPTGRTGSVTGRPLRSRAVNGALLLASIPAPGLREISIGPFDIRLYALCLLAGVVVASWIAMRRWAAEGGDPELVLEVTLWSVLGRAHRRQALPRHHELRPARRRVVRALRDLGGRPRDLGRRAGGRPGRARGSRSAAARACWR